MKSTEAATSPPGSSRSSSLLKCEPHSGHCADERAREEEAMEQQKTTSAEPVTIVADTSVRPFRVEIPQEAVDDLRRRIADTRWPHKELVPDRSQGVQLATLQELARYWANDYDLRRLESRLNALPQFMTEIDGVDIHFIHVTSPHDDALPLIMTHGWPGSVVELLDAVARSRIRWRTAAPPRTHSTWCCRPCLATASPGSRPSSAGSPAASPARGRS
jgi:hypothetical protein